MKNNNNTILNNIFLQYGLNLMDNESFRHPVDIIEDMFLKLNIDEYVKIMKTIANIESQEGFIFDKARNRPYE